MTTVFGIWLPVLIALMGIAFVGGIGITTVGPGGILLTAGLFALTDLPPGTVAGTASATFVATGVLGSAAYSYSRELGGSVEVRTVGMFATSGFFGAMVGARLNALISSSIFGLLLGVLLLIQGLVIWFRSHHSLSGLASLRLDPDRRRFTLTGVGFGIGIAGGLLGVGGPVIAVPLQIIVGVPIRVAVGLAQVQSVLLSAGATAGYGIRGVIVWPLAVILGLPELCGALVGWYVSHSINTDHLKRILVLSLIGLGLFLLIK